MILVITGAAGYLGQRVVDQALARGHTVRAVVRPGRDVSGVCWSGKADVELVEADLAGPDSVCRLGAALARPGQPVPVVIHTAGALIGGDSVQRTETVQATHNLIQAMLLVGVRRLVLLSSLSIYGCSALPDGAQLDEATPAEPEPAERDAYCRAKLAQEAMALAAAQSKGLLVTALRAGVIFGPGRLWTARLGVARGTLGLLLGGGAAVPVTYVEHCAKAVLLAAEITSPISDVYAVPDPCGRLGAFEAINVVDDDLPTQSQYAALLRKHTGGTPAILIRLPWRFVRQFAAAFTLLGIFWPGLVSRLPGLLRPATIHARLKPLRYSNCRLHDRLGWLPGADFADALTKSASPGKPASPLPRGGAVSPIPSLRKERSL